MLLLVMANTAKDDDDPPTYFAGWRPLALALGFKPDDDTAELSSSAERAVQRAIAVLTRHGLVSVDPAHRRSHKRRYRLHLPGPSARAAHKPDAEP